MTHRSQAGERMVCKVVISGGFGVGKTTAIGSVSDIPPLRTEEQITQQSAATDSLNGVERKTTTTVAIDFGRVGWDVPIPIELYLFGTPGQPRFWDFWYDLSDGSFGALLLADTRRLDTSFRAADFFEEIGLPYVIAVNVFPGTPRRPIAEIREAFDVEDRVPVLFCDARRPESVAGALRALIKYVVQIRSATSSLLDA
ncbi:ATP/GTP-binding protein [Streptomyces sp. NPDC047072]|uniref:GTP-binding protein n=1 Tax=Streptomyces sp. NPDC047072 TaxID=3154809 RepID=UPI0033C4ABF9